MSDTPNILEGFVPETEFAAANGICPRTVKRYRDQGLPYVLFRGVVHIDVPGGREWLLRRVRRANPPRAPK